MCNGYRMVSWGQMGHTCQAGKTDTTILESERLKSVLACNGGMTELMPLSEDWPFAPVVGQRGSWTCLRVLPN